MTDQAILQLRPKPMSTSSATQMLPIAAHLDEILDWDVAPIVIHHKTESVKVKVTDIESQPMLPA